MEQSSFLQRINITNLYGWAMSQTLPANSFRLISKVEEFTFKRISKLIKENKRGYLLGVDMDYPEELDNIYKRLLFMIEKININKVDKLVLNLNSKGKYVVHIQALNQALKHKLIIKKLLQVIKFEQSAYISEC